jgi:hypothetical protein
MNHNHFVRDEAGAAMITALLAVVILAGLTVVFVGRSTAETRASGFSRDHETTIHAAEASADIVIAEVSADPEHVSEDRDGVVVQVPSATMTQAEEKQWALDLLPAMEPVSGAAATSWLTTDVGEAYAVRPLNAAGDEPLSVIYAVGAVPSFDHANPRTRVIKLQIDKTDWFPDFAILTDSVLTFGGNAAIIAPACDTSTPEKALETCYADVHTNQNFTNPGSASVIQGQVSAAQGVCPSGVTATNGCVDSTDGVETKPIPVFTARDFYNRDDIDYNADPEGQIVEWFDLCPNQTIRRPSPNGPCDPAADQVWPDGASTSFRGWRWQAGMWKASSIQAGIFYVYHADASVTGSAGTAQRAVSILVEKNPANPTKSGSLDISGNPQTQAALEDVLFVADHDFDIQGTPSGGTCAEIPAGMSGFIGVGEQLKTQGTVSLRGAIIVRDESDIHGLVQRSNQGIGGTMCLEFDRNLAINFTGRWVVTFWNEL